MESAAESYADLACDSLEIEQRPQSTNENGCQQPAREKESLANTSSKDDQPCDCANKSETASLCSTTPSTDTVNSMPTTSFQLQDVEPDRQTDRSLGASRTNTPDGVKDCVHSEKQRLSHAGEVYSPHPPADNRVSGDCSSESDQHDGQSTYRSCGSGARSAIGSPTSRCSRKSFTPPQHCELDEPTSTPSSRRSSYSSTDFEGLSGQEGEGDEEDEKNHTTERELNAFTICESENHYNMSEETNSEQQMETGTQESHAGDQEEESDRSNGEPLPTEVSSHSATEETVVDKSTDVEEGDLISKLTKVIKNLQEEESGLRKSHFRDYERLEDLKVTVGCTRKVCEDYKSYIMEYREGVKTLRETLLCFQTTIEAKLKDEDLSSWITGKKSPAEGNQML